MGIDSTCGCASTSGLTGFFLETWTVVAAVIVADLALLGVPHFGGTATLGAQQGATVSGSGFAAGNSVYLVDANDNVVATATADTSGNVSFSNAAEGQFHNRR